MPTPWFNKPGYVDAKDTKKEVPDETVKRKKPFVKRMCAGSTFVCFKRLCAVYACVYLYIFTEKASGKDT